MNKLLLGLAAVALAAPAAAAEVNVWSTSFDTNEYENLGPFPYGILSTFYGGASFDAAGSLPGFGSKYLHNTTGGETKLVASGLGGHSALRVKFDIVFQDSWDSTNGSPAPDILYVDLNGTTYEWTVNNASGNVFDVGPGTVVGRANYVGSGWTDTVVSYDFLIPHTDATFYASFRFGGAGFQGGTDESWGIDNWALLAVPSVGGVPEPATWAMLIAGFGLVGAVSRRRRSASVTA
jgi:hypothetical protein